MSESYGAVHFTGSIAGASVDWKLVSESTVGRSQSNPRASDMVDGTEVSAADTVDTAAEVARKTSAHGTTGDNSVAAAMSQQSSQANQADATQTSPALISPSSVPEKPGDAIAVGSDGSDARPDGGDDYLLHSESGEFVSTGDSLLHRYSSLDLPEPPMRKLLHGLWPYSKIEFKTLG